jgi:hypothetical protein
LRCLERAIVHRRRGLAALLPLGILARSRNYLAQHLQSTGGQVAAGGAALATVGVIALAVSHSGSPTKASSLTVRGKPVAPREIANLDRFAGLEVEASGSVVRAVPADEGFWIGGAGANRVWVQLAGKWESPVEVTVGQRLSFVGRIVDHAPSFARRVGLSHSESAPLLRQQRQHVVVQRERLQTK